MTFHEIDLIRSFRLRPDGLFLENPEAPGIKYQDSTPFMAKHHLLNAAADPKWRHMALVLDASGRHSHKSARSSKVLNLESKIILDQASYMTTDPTFAVMDLNLSGRHSPTSTCYSKVRSLLKLESKMILNQASYMTIEPTFAALHLDLSGRHSQTPACYSI